MMRTLGAILLIVMLPWFIYANRTEQKIKCVAYELTGHRQGFPDNVTCILNGNG